MINIIVDNLLPIDETRQASCVETKEPVNVLTGEKIHCYKHGNTLIMSEELYQKFIAEQSDPKG